MNILNKSDIKQLVLLFVASLIVSLPYFLYSPKQGMMAVLVLMILAMLHKTIFLVAGIYSLLINSFFMHLVTTWGGDSLVSRIQASYESATYERWEYFKTYIGITDIVMTLGYINVALFVIYIVVKKLELSSFARKISLVVSVLTVVASLLIFPTLETLKNFQLVHLPLTMYTTHNNLSVINKRTTFLQAAEDTKISCPNSFDKIIFIQGESANKHHMSVYGYERKTTPFFDSIKPYTFDAIAPANQTRFAIPIELTDATVENFDVFYKDKSIVSKLSSCGYTTHWISNQGKTGEFDTTITSIAKEADHTYFLNDLDYTTAGLDGNVLKTLDSIDTKTPEKQAFFIHLLGSHFSYADRYPADKAFMQGDDVVTHYDNSIHYTDWVISEIYKRFPNENALYIYLSDHSEVVQKGGHGYSPSFKGEYEIPLVMWGKEQQRLSTLFEETKGKLLNTESLNHIIEYLTGINDAMDVSYSTKVMSVIPENVVDYSTLLKYKKGKN